MSQQEAANDISSSIKDFSAGWFFLVVAVAALALAVYFRRSLTLSDLVPSSGRLQQIATVAAFILFGIAAFVALWQEMWPEWQNESSTVWSTLSSIKELNSAGVILAAGLIVSVIAFYWLQSSEESVADFWQAHRPTLDGLRSYAVAIAGALVTCIVVGSIISFFWTAAGRSEFTSIAPFIISGADDKQRGTVLATAFQAKLSELLRDAHILDDVLGTDADNDADNPVPNQDASEARSLNVYQKLDLDLKFQGVDVGGILNGVVNWMAMRRAMQITVAEKDDKAIVSGALRPGGESHVYANVNGNEDVVAAVAYSILRDRMIAQQSGFEALDWKDIRSLHLSVLEVTRLRTRSNAKSDDYKAHQDVISTLLKKAPGVEALLSLGAEVAMKAGNVDLALAYLDRSKEFLNRIREDLDHRRPAPDEEEDDIDFKEAKKKFVTKYNSFIVQRQRVISSSALPLVERLNMNGSAEPIFTEALAKHRALLKIDSVQSKKEVTVAIVGGIPQRDSIGYKFKSKGEGLPGKYGLDNFADTIGLIVTTLAPSAKLMFIPLGTDSRARGLTLVAAETEISEAVGVAVKAGADVVVIPFAPTPMSDWTTRIETMEGFSSRATIVSPAPSRSAQDRSIQNGISDIPAAFVASVDVDGKFKGGVLSTKEVVASYPGAVWAPGTRIPRLTADGTWQTTYGIAYATATAAAAIANVAGGTGIKEPKALIDLIKGTLQHREDRPEIGIIDQTAALKAPSPAAAVHSPSADAK